MRVEKSMSEQNWKVLLISSAVPSEGKTTVSNNLALAMANRDKKVLLIDCDLRNPSVAKLLRMSNAPALSDYLEGN
jgi:Mrp family chromosome partitioning ATPase